METAISFGTDGWRATLDEFTAPRVRMVGQAVVDYLDEAGLGDDPIVVGYDARETSEGFAKELARVLASGGHDVIVPERDRPTPLVAWAIVDRDLAGGLMITASHNPPEYNGVKFIPEDGAPALPEVTDRIMDNLREPDPLPESEHGSVRRVDLVESHADQAMDLVDADLSELAVAYDAMHGSGRGTTDALLERAGATVERRRCERDPEFGGVSPEPNAENLAGLVDAVESGDADLGIANDGDSDRIAVVTPERGFLDENLLFAALYDYLLEDQSGPAVRSVSTTFLIDEIAEANGEAVVETPVGFKWVARAMAEHDALIGGEESGGFTIRGHVREKDGVLAALLAAAAESEESLDERVDRLLDAHGDIVPGKISVDCPDDQKAAAMAAIEDALPDELAGRAVAETSTVDGVKLLLDDGSWVLVRPSGTEPKLRVYAEAGSTEAVDALLADGRELVEANV